MRWLVFSEPVLRKASEFITESLILWLKFSGVLKADLRQIMQTAR